MWHHRAAALKQNPLKRCCISTVASRYSKRPIHPTLFASETHIWQNASTYHLRVKLYSITTDSKVSPYPNNAATQQGPDGLPTNIQQLSIFRYIAYVGIAGILVSGTLYGVDSLTPWTNELRKRYPNAFHLLDNYCLKFADNAFNRVLRLMPGSETASSVASNELKAEEVPFSVSPKLQQIAEHVESKVDDSIKPSVQNDAKNGIEKKMRTEACIPDEPTETATISVGSTADSEWNFTEGSTPPTVGDEEVSSSSLSESTHLHTNDGAVGQASDAQRAEVGVMVTDEHEVQENIETAGDQPSMYIADALAAEVTASEVTAGEATASEVTAAEATAAEVTAGEATAAEATAAEATAAEATDVEVTAVKEGEMKATEIIQKDAEAILSSYTVTPTESLVVDINSSPLASTDDGCIDHSEIPEQVKADTSNNMKVLANELFEKLRRSAEEVQEMKRRCVETVQNTQKELSILFESKVHELERQKKEMIANIKLEQQVWLDTKEREYQQRKEAFEYNTSKQLEEEKARFEQDIMEVAEDEKRIASMEIGELQGKLEAIELETVKSIDMVGAVVTINRLTYLLKTLEEAMEKDRSIKEPLKAFKLALVKDPLMDIVVSTISASTVEDALDKPLPNPKTLNRSFWAVARNGVYAALEPQNGSIFKRIVAYCLSFLYKLESKPMLPMNDGYMEGAQRNLRLLSAVSCLIEEGDWLQAVKLAEQLDGKCKALLTEWIADANLYLTLQQVFRVLRIRLRCMNEDVRRYVLS